MNIDGSDNILNPLSFSAFVADNETYYYHEMIRQPDAVDFLRAMVKEVHDHTQRKHWVLVPRSKAGKNKIIRAVWSFKRKRLPDGLLLKHKARLCVNGSMQVYGVNYWNTYAPVVSWLAVRLMFILSIVEDWYSESIDFTLAFPQAPLEKPIFMEFPVGMDLVGYDPKEYVLELKKTLWS